MLIAVAPYTNLGIFILHKYCLSFKAQTGRVGIIF